MLLLMLSISPDNVSATAAQITIIVPFLLLCQGHQMLPYKLFTTLHFLKKLHLLQEITRRSSASHTSGLH